MLGHHVNQLHERNVLDHVNVLLHGFPVNDELLFYIINIKKKIYNLYIIYYLKLKGRI
jgi:hypothetical protein